MSRIKPGPNRTRAGRDVIVFTVTAKGNYPVVGIIRNTGVDDPASWTIDGKFNYDKAETSSDLMVFADACEGGK